jgi:aspartate racemase
MKKIGIVGGVAWRSTVEYYAGICTRCERLHLALGRTGPAPTPELVIESLDFSTAVSYLGTGEDDRSWQRFDAYHRRALHRLEAAGADFAVIASNTPHHRLDAITKGVDLPVLGIFEVTARACARMGAGHALILGTSSTMTSRRLVEKFRAAGIDATGPRDEGVRSKVEEIVADLQAGKTEGAGARIHRIVEAALDGPPLPDHAVCLCCTELPLAFRSGKDLPTFEAQGVHYLNSTVVHIEAVFERATAEA